MSELKVGDLVKIVRHGDVPNEIYPQHLMHFAVGTIHTVKGLTHNPCPGVYLLDEDKDDFLIHLDEVEKV